MTFLPDYFEITRDFMPLHSVSELEARDLRELLNPDSLQAQASQPDPAEEIPGLAAPAGSGTLFLGGRL